MAEEQDAIAVNAIVSHHFLYGNLTGARALVDDILYEVRIASHKSKGGFHLLTVFTVEPIGKYRIGKVYAIRPFIYQLLT